MEFFQLHHHQQQPQSNTPQTPINKSNISSQASSSTSSNILLSPSLPRASPLGLSHTIATSTTITEGNNREEGEGKNEWWKFSTPSPDDVRLSRSSGGLGGVRRTRRSEEEFKMIGKWRVGKGIGKGTSGEYFISLSSLVEESIT